MWSVDRPRADFQRGSVLGLQTQQGNEIRRWMRRAQFGDSSIETWTKRRAVSHCSSFICVASSQSQRVSRYCREQANGPEDRHQEVQHSRSDDSSMRTADRPNRSMIDRKRLGVNSPSIRPSEDPNSSSKIKISSHLKIAHSMKIMIVRHALHGTEP